MQKTPLRRGILLFVHRNLTFINRSAQNYLVPIWVLFLVLFGKSSVFAKYEFHSVVFFHFFLPPYGVANNISPSG